MKLAVERSGEEKARFTPRQGRHAAFRRGRPEAISAPGRSTERDARRFAGTVEQWRFTPKPKGRRTSLGRRLDELRERIKASGEPLLSSWDEVDRELGERRSGTADEAKR